MRNVSGRVHVVVLLVTACVTVSGAVQAKKETVLYNFSGADDGAYPAAQPAQDRKGNLYGTTTAGGASSSGYGVIFKLEPDGTQTPLHSFSGDDGSEPSGNTILAGKDLYGATLFGGANNLGTIYRLSQNGKFNVLHSFGGSGDAISPSGWVIWDNAGFVYGAAQGGGAFGFGAIYKVAAGNGKEKLVYSFTGGLDGGNPVSCLKLPDGTLYGETTQGGANDAGVVFKITADGTESVLYSFNTSGKGGYSPAGPMANDNSSNLYGTAEFGGKNGKGTAFRVTPDGTFTLLHTFGGANDGAYPIGLFGGTDAFYGTTLQGGSGSGIVYKMEANGALKVFYRFTGGGDGSAPQAPPIVDTHRNIYGTTLDGGSHGLGVVYRLKDSK
jgi:uncharacterized repeat protein (TIGR03803 family)